MSIFRSAYEAHLEAELLKQEALLKNIAAEKERQIVWLREDNKRLRAENDRLMLRLIPTPIPGSKKLPTEASEVELGEGAWQTYLNQQMKKMDDEFAKSEKEKADGVHDQGRQAKLHQPASGDASRPNGSAAGSESEGRSS